MKERRGLGEGERTGLLKNDCRLSHGRPSAYACGRSEEKREGEGKRKE